MVNDWDTPGGGGLTQASVDRLGLLFERLDGHLRELEGAAGPAAAGGGTGKAAAGPGRPGKRQRAAGPGAGPGRPAKRQRPDGRGQDGPAGGPGGAGGAGGADGAGGLADGAGRDAGRLPVPGEVVRPLDMARQLVWKDVPPGDGHDGEVRFAGWARAVRRPGGLQYLAEADAWFPWRDPRDPVGRVYEPYADTDADAGAGAGGRVAPGVRAVRAKLFGRQKELLQEMAASADEQRLAPPPGGDWERVWERLEADVLAMVRDSVSGTPRKPRVVPRVLQPQGLLPHEQQLAGQGQRGLFLAAGGRRRPLLTRGQVLGLYAGAVLEDGGEEALWRQAHPNYPEYAITIGEPGEDGGPATGWVMASEGYGSAVVFANTRLRPGTDQPEADRSAGGINAIFFSFMVTMTGKDGQEREQPVVALAALDNLGPGGMVIADYGDLYLPNLAREPGTGTDDEHVKSEPGTPPLGPAPGPRARRVPGPVLAVPALPGLALRRGSRAAAGREVFDPDTFDRAWRALGKEPEDRRPALDEALARARRHVGRVEADAASDSPIAGISAPGQAVRWLAVQVYRGQVSENEARDLGEALAARLDEAAGRAGRIPGGAAGPVPARNITGNTGPGAGGAGGLAGVAAGDGAGLAVREGAVPALVRAARVLLPYAGDLGGGLAAGLGRAERAAVAAGLLGAEMPAGFAAPGLPAVLLPRPALVRLPGGAVPSAGRGQARAGVRLRALTRLEAAAGEVLAAAAAGLAAQRQRADAARGRAAAARVLLWHGGPGGAGLARGVEEADRRLREIGSAWLPVPGPGPVTVADLEAARQVLARPGAGHRRCRAGPGTRGGRHARRRGALAGPAATPGSGAGGPRHGAASGPWRA